MCYVIKDSSLVLTIWAEITEIFYVIDIYTYSNASGNILFHLQICKTSLWFHL